MRSLLGSGMLFRASADSLNTLLRPKTLISVHSNNKRSTENRGQSKKRDGGIKVDQWGLDQWDQTRSILD
jgi:hypothetical protein